MEVLAQYRTRAFSVQQAFSLALNCCVVKIFPTLNTQMCNNIYVRIIVAIFCAPARRIREKGTSSEMILLWEDPPSTNLRSADPTDRRAGSLAV